jgi:FAD/FMN-containing dehydrogenase
MLQLLFVPLFLAGHLVHAAPRGYDIVDCLSAAGVPQDDPGTDIFEQDSLGWNLRLNFTPVAIAVPYNVSQVQAAVLCAAELGVKVNPKSGGHSYAGHSNGGENGHLIVDLKYFRDTVVDNKTYVATIGPGARLGNVALDLFNQGSRAMAHGICPGYVPTSSTRTSTDLF